MSGRGDNNKHGTSGQGSSNQSNQPFIADSDKEPKSNHGKKQTGGKPSVAENKQASQDANRDHSVNGENDR